LKPYWLASLFAAFTPRRWLLVGLVTIWMLVSAPKGQRAECVERALRLLLGKDDPPRPPVPESHSK
jgi:hypothetical protein